MTNAEFYKEEIQKFDPEQFCEDFVEPNILEKRGLLCRETESCAYCKALMTVWLMEEHKEPAVDWKNVPVDTPILVKKHREDNWTHAYFAKYSAECRICTWRKGKTSFTSHYTDIETWPYAKLWEGSEEQAAEQEAQCTD